MLPILLRRSVLLLGEEGFDWRRDRGKKKRSREGGRDSLPLASTATPELA